MRHARLTAPAEDEVHLWSASLDVDRRSLVRLSRTLSEAERDRARRFRFVLDRERFMVARARLRRLLAGYLGTEPAVIELLADRAGKLRLSTQSHPGLTFNVSHSRDLAVYAVGCNGEVGVDVEFVRDDVPMEAIAQRYLSAEARAVVAALAPSERLEALFGYWTRHEAGLKVSGAGLSGAARTDGAPPAVHMFHAREGFAAAVATEAEVRVPARAAVLEREGEYASSHEATGRDAGGGASRPLLLERILGAKPGEERFRRDDLNAGSD